MYGEIVTSERHGGESRLHRTHISLNRLTSSTPVCLVCLVHMTPPRSPNMVDPLDISRRIRLAQVSPVYDCQPINCEEEMQASLTRFGGMSTHPNRMRRTVQNHLWLLIVWMRKAMKTTRMHSAHDEGLSSASRTCVHSHYAHWCQDL